MASSTKISVSFDTAPLIAGLDHYAVKIVTNGRYAVQKGAKMIHDEAKRLVPVNTGTLRDSIYHTFSADNSEPGKTIVYHIGWNTRKAPHGHLIEYGHWTKIVGVHGPIKPHWVPAHPFLRPAYYGKIHLALEEIKLRMSEKLGGES